MRAYGFLVCLAGLLSAGPAAFGREDGAAAPVTRREWLSRHQSPNGSWDPAGFELQCEESGKCGGRGRAEDVPGATALAILAFLGYGETPDTPRYGGEIRRGLAFLLEIQDKDGCLGPRTSRRLVVNHARATFALASVAARPAGATYAPAARKAVGFLVALQIPGQGWPTAQGGEETDLAASTWAVEALVAAKKATIEIGEDPFRGILSWLDARTDPETGRVGPKPSVVGAAGADRSDAESALPETATAMGTLVRILAGADPKSDPVVRKGIRLLVAASPACGSMSGLSDADYCYFGTRSCAEAQGDGWSKWSYGLLVAVIKTQCLERAECRFGSWSPVDASKDEGRVIATALGVLCLETFYRMAR